MLFLECDIILLFHVSTMLMYFYNIKKKSNFETLLKCLRSCTKQPNHKDE